MCKTLARENTGFTVFTLFHWYCKCYGNAKCSNVGDTV